MEISIVDKVLVIVDGNNRWELSRFDLQDPPTKSPQGYILFGFRSTRSLKGTYEIRIYSKDVSLPDHNGLDDLFVILLSWYNLAQRRRAFDDVTEQFDNFTQILSIYPIGVPLLYVGNEETQSLWVWTIDHWQDTHIPNHLGGYRNRAPIPFVNTDRPTITDYQSVYATQFTQNPTVSLWAYDTDGNYTQRSETAQTTLVDGKIDTIFFYLPAIMNGNIILS